eukprot:1719985-Rhodomonas_salina.2
MMQLCVDFTHTSARIRTRQTRARQDRRQGAQKRRGQRERERKDQKVEEPTGEGDQGQRVSAVPQLGVDLNTPLRVPHAPEGSGVRMQGGGASTAPTPLHDMGERGKKASGGRQKGEGGKKDRVDRSEAMR